MAVWIQLPFGWNTNLLLISNIVNFLWKTDDVKVETNVLLISDI